MANIIDLDTNMVRILTKNPKVSDKALEGVVESNIVGFKGTISVATKVHHFATGDKLARVIYISPYGNFQDFLVDIKRFLVGVEFNNFSGDTNAIAGYVLGTISEAQMERAHNDTQVAFNQGRRFIVSIACDCSNISIDLDANHGCQLI